MVLSLFRLHPLPGHLSDNPGGLARARDEIAKQTAGAEDIQFIFISVDPNRDTISILKQYVGYFHKTFVGVTGDDTQIGNLAGQLGAA